MLSKGEATQWPMLLDMTKDECRKILRRLELEAYSSVVTVLRAQGSFSTEKKRLLQDLANMLSISTERHRAEVRLAVNSEKLATIAQHVAGPNTGLEWSREGRRIVPLMPRLVPQTAFIPKANQAADIVAAKNAQLPQPSQTAKKSDIKKEVNFKHPSAESSVSQPHINNTSALLSVPSTSNTSLTFVAPPPTFIPAAVPSSKSNSSVVEPPSPVFVVPHQPSSPSNHLASSSCSTFCPVSSASATSSNFVAPNVPPSLSSSTLNEPSTVSSNTSSGISFPVQPPCPSTLECNTPSSNSHVTRLSGHSPSTFIVPAVTQSPSALTVKNSSSSKSAESTLIVPHVSPNSSTLTLKSTSSTNPVTSTDSPSTFTVPSAPKSAPSLTLKNPSSSTNVVNSSKSADPPFSVSSVYRNSSTLTLKNTSSTNPVASTDSPSTLTISSVPKSASSLTLKNPSCSTNRIISSKSADPSLTVPVVTQSSSSVTLKSLSSTNCIVPPTSTSLNCTIPYVTKTVSSSTLKNPSSLTNLVIPSKSADPPPIIPVVSQSSSSLTFKSQSSNVAASSKSIDPPSTVSQSSFSLTLKTNTNLLFSITNSVASSTLNTPTTSKTIAASLSADPPATCIVSDNSQCTTSATTINNSSVINTIVDPLLSADSPATFIEPASLPRQSLDVSLTPSNSAVCIASSTTSSISTCDFPSSTTYITSVDPSLITVVSGPTSSTISSQTTDSANRKIPVDVITSASDVFNSSSTSSILSSIPLISVPPSTSLSSPVVFTNFTPSSSVIEVIDVDENVTIMKQPLETTLVNKVEEKCEQIEVLTEDMSKVDFQPPSSSPTLMLPSGMSIQLREEETDKPKKRKRSVSQETPTPHKKMFTVPVTKTALSVPSRAVSFQAPVKISVNTPVINRTPFTNLPSSSTSMQKVIIMSNTNSAANPRKSLNIIKSNHNRFQNPHTYGNSLPSANTKLRPKMVTVPAKCRPRNSSLMIPMSSSIQNVQLKPDDITVVDSTVKRLTIPKVPGNTRILPKPSSMLIVKPESNMKKVPLTSGNPRLEAKQTRKSNVVIVQKGAVTKGLKISNASKELVNKMLTNKNKSVPAQPSPPMPIATTSGNLIVLDLSQEQYNRNATLSEILQASGIMLPNLTPTPQPEPVQEDVLKPQGTTDEPAIAATQCIEIRENADVDADVQQDVTTDLSNSEMTFVSADKQFEPQPMTSQIIIETVPAQISNEPPQVRLLPPLDAAVSIQHSDLDASNLCLEEYTSQQLENQSLT